MLPSAAYEIFLWTASSSALVLLPLLPPSPGWRSLPFSHLPSALSEGSTGWLLHWSWVGEWGGGGKREGWGELSLGSHLVPSCYFWGRALSPLLDGGKSMGYTLARRENMASLGTGGKSWSWLCTLVCTLQPGWVQPLAEAEYITKLGPRV